jgi:membrane protein implicated in regulation of membrane protease activity
MGPGGKIMACIALAVAAMVIKRYMKKREKEDKRNRQEMQIYNITVALFSLTEPNHVTHYLRKTHTKRTASGNC